MGQSALEELFEVLNKKHNRGSVNLYSSLEEIRIKYDSFLDEIDNIRIRNLEGLPDYLNMAIDKFQASENYSPKKREIKEELYSIFGVNEVEVMKSGVYPINFQNRYDINVGRNYSDKKFHNEVRELISKFKCFYLDTAERECLKLLSRLPVVNTNKVKNSPKFLFNGKIKTLFQLVIALEELGFFTNQKIANHTNRKKGKLLNVIFGFPETNAAKFIGMLEKKDSQLSDDYIEDREYVKSVLKEFFE